MDQSLQKSLRAYLRFLNIKYMKLFRASEKGDLENKNLLIDRLLEEFNVTLPRLYTEIQLEYTLGQYSEIWDAYIDKYLRIMPVSEIVYYNEYYSFPYGWLYSLEELKLDLEFSTDNANLLSNHEVIRIGNIVSGGGLYLGVGEKNQDFIYKMVWDHDSNPIKISDSIFHFLNDLKIVNIYNSQGLESNVGKIYFKMPNMQYAIKQDVVSSLLGKKEDEKFVCKEELISNLDKIIADVRNTNFR